MIGGLFTSTMLTMVALPLLFEIFSGVTGVKLFPLRLVRDERLTNNDNIVNQES